MSYEFTITNSGAGVATASVLMSDGEMFQVSEETPSYKELVVALATNADDATILGLARPVLAIGANLRRLSERITFDGRNVAFDGDILNNALGRQLASLVAEGGNEAAYASMVAFMEKLYQNPSKKSRESLHGFLQRWDITILPDGDFIAYKGVDLNGLSYHAGYGIVDGKVIEHDHLPNEKGSTVEMPRTKVDDDTERGCSTGLHAGSYEYASSFANSLGQGRLLTVKINPRDVVSVPDCSTYQKIRTCRYVILDTVKLALPQTYMDFDVDNDWSADFGSDEDDENEDETIDDGAEDLDEEIRADIEDLFNPNEENNFINFLYPSSKTGERELREGYNIERVVERSNFAGLVYDALFVCKNADGEYRSFLYSKMSHINFEDDTLDNGVPHIPNADVVTPINPFIDVWAQRTHDALSEDDLKN